MIALPGRRAYLAGPCGPTTSAAEELNCRVRDGNGCGLLALAARKSYSTPHSGCSRKRIDDSIRRVLLLSPRPISIANLSTLLHLQTRPINPVVFRGSYSFGWEI